jgi:hypothetical protein
MPKRLPKAAEVAASLDPSTAPATPPASAPRVPVEARAEIVRSLRFTRAQMDYLNRMAGKLTTQTGRSVSINEVVRQLIDEKLKRTP